MYNITKYLFIIFTKLKTNQINYYGLICYQITFVNGWNVMSYPIIFHHVYTTQSIFFFLIQDLVIYLWSIFTDMNFYNVIHYSMRLTCEVDL